MYDDLSNNKIRVTSYQKLIDELEPYLIYNNDVVFYQYVALQECLNHSMREYYKDIGWAYQALNQFFTERKTFTTISPFFDFFKEDNTFNSIDCKCYDLKETETSTEYLNKIISIDNGSAFNNCVALNDVNNRI